VDERRGGAEESDLLTLQEAADALKVHYMTAYRWVRKGDLAAFKAGGRLRVRSTDLDDFVAAREVDTAAPARESRRTDWPVHVQRLHALLLDGAAAEAAALTRKVIADGAPVGDVYIRLIGPAMHRVGEDWAMGRITIAEEHRATEIVSSTLARLAEHFRRRGPARGTAITLTPAGDQHALAANMVADFLRGGGYDVHHLGVNVPAESLRLFLDMTDADVVCVSITRQDLGEEIIAELVDAGRGHSGILTVIGGQGTDPALAERVGAVHIGELAELTDRLGEHLPG
jgi:MerR family transcriptional regulator, light-induced transcriptional regulator